MIHKMKIASEPFSRIKRGVKKIEVRLYDEKRRKINLGDEIVLYKLPNFDESINLEVKGLSIFRNFNDLFKTFGTEPFGHSKDTTTSVQVKDMYEVYTKEDEEIYGVIGIHINKKSSS